MSVEAQSASHELGVAAPPRGMALLRAIALQAGLALLTLAGLELFLRVADFREVRLIPEQFRLPYQHDPELGWYPNPGKITPQGDAINSIGRVQG